MLRLITHKKICTGITTKCTPAVLMIRLQTAFRAGVEFSQRWIPVNDICPLPTGDDYLVKDASGRVWTYTEYKISDSEEPITHYRPIEYKI